MSEERNDVVKEIKRDIKIDGMLSQGEKTAMREALVKDKNAVIEATKNELRDFILGDYAKRSLELVGKKGVKQFQAHIGVKTDGIYGPETFKGVIRYQAQQGLLIDGIIGSETLHSFKTKSTDIVQSDEKDPSLFGKIFSKDRVGKKEVPLELSPRDIKKVQNYKEFRGKDGGELTQAIKKFQKISGLKITGNIDRELLDSIKSLSQNDVEKTTSKTKKDKNNFSSIGIDKLPESWKKIFKEFVGKLKINERNDVIKGIYPITLADSKTQRALFINNGKVQKEIPVIFGYGGFVNGSVVGKGKTPRGVVSYFNDVNIAKDTYGKAANNPEKSPTVIGAAILSPQGAAGGGKWFHGVADNRIAAMRNSTAGCVGMSVQDARTVAFQVQKKGRGFGYVA